MGLHFMMDHNGRLFQYIHVHYRQLDLDHVGKHNTKFKNMPNFNDSDRCHTTDRSTLKLDILWVADGTSKLYRGNRIAMNR